MAAPHLTEIRKEKDRFNPEWSPKYLAYSANLSLGVVFNDIASLISRGNRAGLKMRRCLFVFVFIFAAGFVRMGYGRSRAITS